jgi:hypothetical protein
MAFRIIRNGTVATVLTDDVSVRGAFLRTDAPPLLRQLVPLEATIPDGPTIRTGGVVAYRVVPGTRDVPGAGIQFYGLEGRERAEWEEFVSRISARAQESAAPIVLAPPHTPDPIRRRWERYSVRLEARIDGLEGIATLHTQNLSSGGIAFTATNQIEPGTEVRFELVHPQSGALLALDGVVRRSSVGDAVVGMELIHMDGARRAALERFVQSALPPREAFSFIAESDPRLA